MNARLDVKDPQALARLIREFNPSAAISRPKPQVDPSSDEIELYFTAKGFFKIRMPEFLEPEPKIISLPHVSKLDAFAKYHSRVRRFDCFAPLTEQNGPVPLYRWDDALHHQRGTGALVTLALETQAGGIADLDLLARMRFYADDAGLYTPELTLKTLGKGRYKGKTRREFADSDSCIGTDPDFMKAVGEAAFLFDRTVVSHDEFPIKNFNAFNMVVPAVNYSSRHSALSIYIHTELDGTIYPVLIHTTFDSNKTARIKKDGFSGLTHQLTGETGEVENEAKAVFGKTVPNDPAGLMQRIEAGIARAKETLGFGLFEPTELSKVERAIMAATEDMRVEHWGGNATHKPITGRGLTPAFLYNSRVYAEAPTFMEVLGNERLRAIFRHTSAELAANSNLPLALRQANHPVRVCKYA